jgi:hypothetical protein
MTRRVSDGRDPSCDDAGGKAMTVIRDLSAAAVAIGACVDACGGRKSAVERAFPTAEMGGKQNFELTLNFGRLFVCQHP